MLTTQNRYVKTKGKTTEVGNRFLLSLPKTDSKNYKK